MSKNSLLSIKRIFKIGFVTFWRDGAVSFATVVIMVATLFVIGSLILVKAVLVETLTRVEDKVDITVYFKTTALENDIFALQNSVEKLAEVKRVEYISREDALLEFEARHSGNELITQSLEELDENPLGANLNIKTKELSQYESVANFLASADSENLIIDKVNYFQNKVVIDKLSKIMDASKKLGWGISLILIFISIFVIFNTIRLAIFFSKEEISVMRLVGATNNYVRGPFIVEGAMYGIFATIITMILFYPFTLWVGAKTDSIGAGLNLFNYYLANFIELFFLLAFVGIILGALSSWLAVRKYLKV